MFFHFAIFVFCYNEVWIGRRGNVDSDKQIKFADQFLFIHIDWVNMEYKQLRTICYSRGLQSTICKT